MDFRMIFDFVTNVPRHVRNNAAELVRWVQNNLTDTANVIMLAAIIEMVGFIAGLGLAKAEATREAGLFLLNACSVTALLIAMWGYVRLAALVELAVLGNRALTQTTQAITHDQAVFPELIDEIKAKHILQAGLAVMLALAGAASYATIFPVYDNLTAFLGATILAAFCILMVTYFNLPDMFNVKRKLVIFAFIMLVVKTVSLILPVSVTKEMNDTKDATINRSIEQRKEDRKLQKMEDPVIKNKIEAIRAEQRRILTSHTELTDTDRDRLDDLRGQIKDLRSEDLSGEGNSGTGFVYRTTHYKEYAVIVALALLFAAWRVFKKPSLGGGGHGH